MHMNDLDDIGDFAADWLTDEDDPNSTFDDTWDDPNDGIIDLYDFATLSENWTYKSYVPEKRWYYMKDALGSVMGLVGSHTDVESEFYEYDVYGMPEEVSDVGNPYLWTARRVDSFDGMEPIQYNRHRYYDYLTWYSPDPLGMVPRAYRNRFKPLRQYKDGLNLYGYVGNRPINYTDAYGLWKLPEHMAMSIAAYENLSCCVCSNKTLFYYGLLRGSTFPDIPVEIPIPFWGDFIDNIVGGAMDTYQSHFGKNQWWHAMASSNEDRASSIRNKIYQKFTSNASAAQKTGSCYNKGFLLGFGLHLIQDSYSRSHAIRGNGGIEWFQNYADQDPDKHATADTEMGNQVQYNSAVEASKKLLNMIVCKKVSPHRMDILRDDILKLAPGAKAGGTHSDYEPKKRKGKL